MALRADDQINLLAASNTTADSNSNKSSSGSNVVNRNGTVYFFDAQLGRIVTLPPDTVVRLGRPL